MPPLRFMGVLVALAAGVGGVVVWQYRTTVTLRDELARQRGLLAEAERVRARLAELKAKQISPAELARRREDHAAWVGLAAEIKTARDRTEARKAASPSDSGATEPRSMTRLPVAAGEWRNAGQESPAAAFETVLWAAAGGDMEKLAASLELDEPVRVAVTEYFEKLPAVLKRELVSPEQMVALLTARVVPLGSAWVLGEFQDQPQETRLVAQLADAEGTKRDLLFTLREREGQWRLVVPPQALLKYAAFLQGTPAAATR